LAAPIVSGVAALILNTKPELNVQQLKALMMGTTSDLNAQYNIQGSGLLNSLAAVKSEITTDQAVINLGWFDEMQQLDYVKSVTVQNLTDESQAITFSVVKEIGNPITYSPSTDSITIAPGSSAILHVSISVPEELSVREYGDSGYLATLQITSNKTQVSVPIALSHTNRITVNFEEFDSYFKDFYLLEKGKGLTDNFWFGQYTQKTHSYILKEGTYTVLMAATNSQESREYILSKIDIDNGQNIDFKLSEGDFHKVDFDIVMPSGGRFDQNGDLPSPLSINIRSIFPGVQGQTGFPAGFLNETKPPFKLFLSQPSDKLFYDIQVTRFDEPMRLLGEVLLQNRIDVNSIEGEKLLFKIDASLMRTVNFAYATYGNKTNHFINPYEWEYSYNFEIPQIWGWNSASIKLPDEQDTSFSIVSLTALTPFRSILKKHQIMMEIKLVTIQMMTMTMMSF